MNEYREAHDEARAPRWWRITSRNPRETLAITWYVITVFLVVSALRLHDPVATVVGLVPAPASLAFGICELWRALTEGDSRGK